MVKYIKLFFPRKRIIISFQIKRGVIISTSGSLIILEIIRGELNGE